MNTRPAFRYTRSSFRPLPVRLEHVDIRLNFLEPEVDGRITLRMTAREPIEQIRFDARELEVHGVWGGAEVPGVRFQASEMKAAGSGNALQYDYRRDASALIVTLPRRMAEGERLVVHAHATCIPTDNILEGLYKDTTPAGGPRQYISQCEQWGFQRILPILDDCTAKCTFRTTLEADSRYTHLISNGDVCRDTNPDGKPILKPDDPSRKLVTYELKEPMAPYLFVVCVGTWDTLEDEVTYPSGRRVRLEYLVPPGRIEGAQLPLKILKDAILWHAKTQEYEYRGEVYRTICMEKSNFGGMENVGNTTIITSAALVDEYTSDERIEYAYGIIIHEFEHNQCGSDVTMETPFDMWLNEAFTVDVERQYSMSRFDPDQVRLDNVAQMRSPVHGPLAIEDGGHLGMIAREGFHDPDELVDGVTYVKAAEVIRMLKLILTPEVFRKAKNAYFARYTGANANTDQFFACFEEISGHDLGQFRREWLHTIGYPVIEAEHSYDSEARKLSVAFHQSRTGTGGPFHVPIEMAAVDADGNDITGTACILELKDAETTRVFEDVPEPIFVSMNRNASFYGTFRDRSANREQWKQQVRLDPNLFNRVEAMRYITDEERIRIIRDPEAAPSEDWLNVFGSVLRDTSLPAGLKSYLLGLDEQSVDRKYLPMYRERYHARIRILQTIAARFLPELRVVYDSIDTYTRGAEPQDGIAERRLKAVVLRMLCEADTGEVQKLAEDHFHRAWNISDKLAALRCVQATSHPRLLDLFEEAHGAWKDHIAAYTAYLACIGASRHDDVFDRIAAEEQRTGFRISHPGHSRALFMPLGSNNKMLWTDQGLDWLVATVGRLAEVNENTALRLVDSLRLVNKLADDLKPKVIAALVSMRERIDADAVPALYGRIGAYLGG